MDNMCYNIPNYIITYIVFKEVKQWKTILKTQLKLKFKTIIIYYKRMDSKIYQTTYKVLLMLLLLLVLANSQDTIKKCLLQGNVQNSGYEIGLLYLPVGTGIALHNHTTDGEKYMIISNNTFKIVGDEYFSTENICLPGESHGIEPVKEDTIILNIKVAKDLLNDKLINYQNNMSSLRFSQNLHLIENLRLAFLYIFFYVVYYISNCNYFFCITIWNFDIKFFF